MKQADARASRRAPKLLDAEGLWDYALKLLGMRALSAEEMRTKLRRRAADPGDIDSVIGKLREYKYIDDPKFAEGFATARRDAQGFGKHRVMRDLQQRRVPKTVAERAVAEAFTGVDEIAMIEQFLERKFRNKDLHEYLQEEKHLAAAYRRLRYAGFSSAASTRVLKRYSERAEELQDEPAESE